jgi:hypothetical protein
VVGDGHASRVRVAADDPTSGPRSGTARADTPGGATRAVRTGADAETVTS